MLTKVKTLFSIVPLFSACLPACLQTEIHSITYIITLLTGKPLAWAPAILGKQGPECLDYKTFTTEMLHIFDQSAAGQKASKQLLYNSTWERVDGIRWPSAPPSSSLSDVLKDRLASAGYLKDLEYLVSQIVQLDNRL